MSLLFALSASCSLVWDAKKGFLSEQAKGILLLRQECNEIANVIEQELHDQSTWREPNGPHAGPATMLMHGGADAAGLGRRLAGGAGASVFGCGDNPERLPTLLELFL